VVRDWTHTQIDFYYAVWYVRRIQQREEQAHLSEEEVRGEFGIDGGGQRRKVDALRKDLRSKMEAIGERVRSELEGIL
jgi:hypothetical protein